MRVGLFGGSFDPVHRGHVALAEAALADLGLDRVLFLPTACPPHKPDREFAPAPLRYALVELALLEAPHLWVSPLEMDTSRPVFAIETLERLRREAPQDEHVLIVGADSLASFDTWRDWRAILARWEVGVLARPGIDWRAVEVELAPALRQALAAARVRWVHGAEHQASSSEIRRRRREGEPVPEGWLDARVLSLLEKYRLYR